MQWVVAIDGGGSKIAVALQALPEPMSRIGVDPAASHDTNYHCLQFVGTGSAHPQSWSQSQANLRGAIEAAQAWLPAGDSIRLILFALAGAGRKEEQQRVVQWARSLPALVDSAVTLRCVGDIDPLVDHRLIEPTSTIAVILGTGSIVAARKPPGDLVRAGGWGPQLGDECSGAALGLAALRTVCQWIDRGTLADATPLVRSLVGEILGREWNPQAESGSATLDIPHLSAELIRLAADRGLAAKFSLALVQSALEANDAEADNLLQPHLQAIAQQVASVSRRAWPDSAAINLVFAGGLVARQPELQAAIVTACVALGVPVQGSAFVDPLTAALKMAIRLCD